MGISDRHIEYKDKYEQPGIRFSINSPVVMLIIINFSVFLFVQFLAFGNATGDTSISPYLTQKLSAFLVPSGWSQLGSQPWSALTYSIFHYSFLNIVSNMLWFWAFGTLLLTVAGDRTVFPVYIYGAIGGALVFVTIASLVGGGPWLPMNASNAAVMAVAVAATTLAPNYRILPQLGRGIPIWTITVLYLIIDFAGMGLADKRPYYAAHLGGAVTGLLFMLSYKNGYDWGAWMNRLYNWFMGLLSPEKNKEGNGVKEKVFYEAGNRNPYTRTANITQQRVDEILDKISQKGYDKLTKEEKDILKRASENDQ